MKWPVKAEFWNERYRGEEYAYGAEPNDFLRAHAGLFGKGARILSLAEGEGRNAVFLAQQGCFVRGVDFSKEGQRKALRLAASRGVAIEYELADLTQYDPGEQIWDGVVSVFCHMAEHERPALYRRVAAALKPGGIFLLESYNKGQLELGTGGPKDASYLLAKEDLDLAFEGFEILLSHDLFRTVEEGEHHRGRSSVTQFLARKPL